MTDLQTAPAPPERARPQSHRRPLWTVGAVLVVVLLTGVAILLALHPSDDPVTTSAGANAGTLTSAVFSGEPGTVSTGAHGCVTSTSPGGIYVEVHGSFMLVEDAAEHVYTGPSTATVTNVQTCDRVRSATLTSATVMLSWTFDLYRAQGFTTLSCDQYLALSMSCTSSFTPGSPTATLTLRTSSTKSSVGGGELSVQVGNIDLTPDPGVTIRHITGLATVTGTTDAAIPAFQVP